MINRLEKKCLLASAGLHCFLLLVLVLGSAFFVSSKRNPIDNHALKLVPSKLVEDALSGGGGNPKIAPSEERQKGETLVPQPAPVEPVVETPPPKPKPPEPKPEPVKPAPKPEVKKAEPVRVAKKPVVKSSKDQAKDSNPTPKPVKPEPLDLTPVKRNVTDVAKERQVAEAKRAAEASQRAASQLARAAERLKEGFSDGTVIEVSGPGGEAYANYSQYVKEIYDNAWVLTGNLLDDNSTARVSVTIARDGTVLEARIINRSGNTALDSSVERALRKVKSVPPFPEGSKERQRTFLINFNLKAKRLLG